MVMKYSYTYRNNWLLWSEINVRQEWCTRQFGERHVAWDRQTFNQGSDDEILANSQVNGVTYVKVSDTFYFENEAHLNWFILRWV